MQVKVRIIGKVQGVWYRAWTKETAISLGLTGYVRNLEDGSVEAVFQGEQESVNKMLAQCNDGPPYAEVEDVITEQYQKEKDYSDFDILR